MRHYVICCMLIGVVGCQPIPVKDESSPYYLPPLGSQLELKRQITIKPDSVSVYLQYGKILPERDIDSYHANCKFEVKNRLNHEQEVTPDHFDIYKIQRDTEVVLAHPIMVAGLGLMSDGDAPMAEIFSTTFYLRSARQPQVLYLTCQHWDDPTTGNHLNLKQVREALGNVMSLQIASGH